MGGETPPDNGHNIEANVTDSNSGIKILTNILIKRCVHAKLDIAKPYINNIAIQARITVSRC